MRKSKILYIGNNLSGLRNNITTIDSLSFLLEKEGYVVNTSSSKKNKFLRIIDMCFSIIKLRKSIDFVLIDTYSTTNFYYAVITSQLARLFKLKYLPILHGGNLPYRLDNSNYLSKLIFNNSQINIAPSGYLKEEFEKRRYAVKQISNVIDIKNYTYKERNKIAPNILYVRAFAEIYNPKMAIYVLAEIIKKYPKAKLCMVGPDKEGILPEIKVLIKELNLESKVEFTGLLSKKEWHARSKDFDIFINTTNVDNTPVSVIEAMALGLPIVSTNVGGIPYLIDDKVDGLLVKKENIDQMTEAIFSLVEGKHKEMSTKARVKAETFGWDTIKYKWLEVLK